MPSLKLGICDPAVRRVERGPVTWFVSGALGDDCDRLSETADGAAERSICERRGDASIIRIVFGDGKPRQASLWRGLSSSFLLYLCQTPDGDICLSDSFRWIISCLPPSLRSPSQAALVDHFMFGNVYGEGTYSEIISKLAHGQEVHIDLKTGNRTTRVFDRVPLSPPERDTDSYVREIDEGLVRFAEARAIPGDSVVLFSGGIDSTILGYYAGSALPLANMRTPPFNLNAKLEAKYCDDAARLLGQKCAVLVEEPTDFPAQLAACIDSLGSPPHELHMTWFDDAFRKLDYRNFLIAERADALLGLGGRVARLASHFTWTPAFWLLQLATAIMPRSERFRWHTVLPAARRLRYPPGSIHSYGALTSTFTDFDLLTQVFGEKQIEERLQARLDYMQQRVELPERYRNNFLRQFEMSQWIKYFCIDTFSLYRQCAHANRKSTYSPFITKDLLRVAGEVPGDVRYIKNGQGKYLLKHLLKAKVPTYQTDQRKAFPSVPLASQYPDGPLGQIWERYNMPDFMNEAVRREVTSHHHFFCWQTIKFAMWDKDIRAAERLAPPTTSETLELELA